MMPLAGQAVVEQFCLSSGLVTVSMLYIDFIVQNPFTT